MFEDYLGSHCSWYVYILKECMNTLNCLKNVQHWVFTCCAWLLLANPLRALSSIPSARPPWAPPPAWFWAGSSSHWGPPPWATCSRSSTRLMRAQSVQPTTKQPWRMSVAIFSLQQIKENCFYIVTNYSNLIYTTLKFNRLRVSIRNNWLIQGCESICEKKSEIIWNAWKDVLFSALKVWKWGFVKSKEVWIQINIWTLTSLLITTM